jgi:hypothetical protein
MTTPADLVLLAAADELTQRRLRVPAADAWQAAHGRRPRLEEWVEIRMMVLRLERAGLVQSDASMTIEVTDAGRAVLEPRNSL